jgi:hypothetical protein
MMKYTVDKNGIVNIVDWNSIIVVLPKMPVADTDVVEDTLNEMECRYANLVREYRNLNTAKMRRKEIIDILVDLEDQIEELKINLSL